MRLTKVLGIVAIAFFVVGIFGCKSATSSSSSSSTSYTAITLSKTTATVAPADSITLTAVTTPSGGTVTWTSSDTKIATVASGVVTGVAVGSATITATCGSLTATCALTVSNSSLTLSSSTLTLAPTETSTLTATSTALTGTTTWTSSSESIATVSSSGVVTAVANGSATITATNGSYSATCSVLVAAYGSKLLSKYDFETLSASVAATGGSNPVAMTFSDYSANVSLSSGKVGTYAMTAVAGFAGGSIAKILPSTSTSGMTISFWVKATSDWSAILNFSSTWLDLPNIYVNADSALTANTWIYPGATVDSTTVGTLQNSMAYSAIMTGTWEHVTIVIDPTASTGGISYYVNGVLMLNYSNSVADIATVTTYLLAQAQSSSLLVANNASTTDAPVSVDDLRFYDGAFTASQVSSLYTNY